MKNSLFLLFCYQLLASLSCSDTISLTFNSLDPVNLIQMKGSSGFGFAFKSAGDIDNDGYEDMIIGAYSLGAAYVVYGGKNVTGFNVASKALNPAVDGFKITGSSGDQFGWSVSSAGDIDNDGYDDIIIGANKRNSNQGAAYVIYGKDRLNMSNIVLSSTTLNPLTTGFMIKGSVTSDWLGASVNSAGDFNKDGHSDIIIGAYGNNNNKGAVYVIYGRERSMMRNFDFSSDTLDPATTGFTVSGNANGDYLGGSVSGAGDINKDGYDDIIIGAPSKNTNKGSVYVIYGREKSNMTHLDLSTTNLSPLTTGFTVTTNTGDYLGNSVSRAGDINNDGYGDIIIGAEWKNNKQGVAYIIYGGEKSSLPNINLSNVTFDPTKNGFTLTMAMAVVTGEIWLGAAVDSAGDINRDGYDDIIISASLQNSRLGAVYVVYGGAKSNMSNLVISSQNSLDLSKKGFSILGTTNDGRFGSSVGHIDINNDGFSDILVGTWSESIAYLLIFYECPANCDQCDSTTECKACEKGFGVNSSKQCEGCNPGNCVTCSTDSSKCDSCSSSYLVYGGQCIGSCPNGTFADTVKCEDCPGECLTCTSLSSCQTCHIGFELSGSQCVEIPVIEPPKTEEKIEEKGGEKAVAGAFEGVSIVGSALSSGSSLPLNFGLVAKILRNIKYMKLPVSRELYETFYSWKVASGFMSAPKSWSEKYSAKTIPVMFSRYKLQAAFLINFWKPLIMTVIGIAVFGIFKLVEVNMGNNKKSTVFTISKQVNVAASNFALTQFYSNLDDVLFYFVLEMRSTKFETGFRVCSSLLAIVLFLVGAVFIILHSQILGKYQKLKEAKSTPQLEDFLSRFANVNLIFKDFKDTNSFTQSFLMINVGRSVTASLIFITLFEYPMIQISFLIVLNILMMVYLWNLKSFQDFTNTCSQLFCEMTLFVANICVFLLALFDHADSYPISSIERLGKCIIALNLILLVGCALLMVVNVGKMLYKIYKDKKNSPQQSLFPPSSEKIISTTKFTRSSSIKSHQNFSTDTGLVSEESQQNLQYQNILEAQEIVPETNPKGRYQQEISRNYSIHHPSRNQNCAQIENFEMQNSNIALQSNPLEDFGETSQPNPLSVLSFPRSRLMRNREVTKARIAKFSQRANNSNYGTPESGAQDLSFHSRMPLDQDSSMNQDVSLTNFD